MKTVLAAAAVAVACVACSSSGGASAQRSSGTGGPAGSASVPASTGKPADPSKSPVLIGFHNLEGGSISLTDMRYGFEAAVDYINQELGGVSGHPLKVDECKTDVTPESAVNCANEFVSKNVVMAVQGVDFAGDAALPILKAAGIVDVSAFAYGPAENSAVGDAYVSEGSNQEGYAAGLQQLKDMGAKSVAQVLANVPSSHSSMTDVINPAAKKLGLTLKPYFYPTQTDWTAFAATVLASHPDAVSLFATDADCLAAVPALRNAGFTGLLHGGVCTALANSLSGSVLNKVVIGNALWNSSMSPMPATIQNDLAVFNKYTQASGHKVKNIGQAAQGFHVAMFAQSLLTQVPGATLTAKLVHDNVGKAKGSLFLRTNGYNCAKPTWPGTTACGSGYVFSELSADKSDKVLPNQPVDVGSLGSK
jgi:branched-chain amino acid transport system substrate-binding protein